MAGNKRKRKKWKQLFTYNFLWPFWFNFINPYILILKRISDFKRNFQNCTLYTWAVKTHLQEVWRDLEIFSLLLLIHAWFPLKAVHFIILAKPTTFFSSEARTTMLQMLIRENGALRSFRLPLGQPRISWFFGIWTVLFTLCISFSLKLTVCWLCSHPLYYTGFEWRPSAVTPSCCLPSPYYHHCHANRHNNDWNHYPRNDRCRVYFCRGKKTGESPYSVAVS